MNAYNLEQFIQKNISMKRPIQEKTLHIIIKQLVNGLEYLHGVKNIIHRDIKPANILINSKGNLKYSDFGESKYYDLKSNSIKGTVLYMAPEIIDVFL